MATLTYDFEADTIGTTPDGWEVLALNGGTVSVQLDGADKRVRFDQTAGNSTLIGCSEAGYALDDMIFSGVFRRSLAASSSKS